MNIEPLRKVQAHILAHPEKLDMDHWICGSAACIAGWTCLLSGCEPGYKSIPGLASRLLGLRPGESFMLFHVDNWPHEIRRKYVLAETPKEAAQAASEAIDAFIAEHSEVRQ